MEQVMDPEAVPDEEMMIPVDMRGVGKEFDSVNDMVSELGMVGAAEAFVKAREYFLANKDEEPEDERPTPMKAAEWKSALAEDDLLEGEEEEDLFDEEGEEEPEDEDEDEAEEPPREEEDEGGLSCCQDGRA